MPSPPPTLNAKQAQFLAIALCVPDPECWLQTSPKIVAGSRKLAKIRRAEFARQSVPAGKNCRLRGLSPIFQRPMG
jgi:hypothetical protein